MEYTKGNWHTEIPEVEPKRVIIDCELPNQEGKRYHRSIARAFGYCDTQDEEYGNADLICAAVNSCISINPSNPLAVAQNIKAMYDLAKSADGLLAKEYDRYEHHHVMSDPTCSLCKIREVLAGFNKVLSQVEAK